MPKTLIIVILDESGSMGSLKSDVLGGFNSFIEDQKKIKNDQAKLYLVKFNTSVSVVHKGVDLENVPELNDQTYQPGGGTALYDAIAEGVRMADKDKTEEERVICVIMTDGEENSSKETTKQQVKDIISSYEAKGDWTFLYIGENPDQWARDAGMSGANAIRWDPNAPRQNMERARVVVRGFRESSARRRDNLFDTP